MSISRLYWKRTLGSITIAVMLVSAFVALVNIGTIPPAKADTNWLTGWQYRRSAVISPASGAGTNYQVRVEVRYNAEVPFTSFDKYAGNPLAIPMYAANGVVHPDVVYFPDGMDGYKYWMVYTGDNGDPERPCIVRSNDGITWVDTGITNPVVNGGGKNNADPAMVYVPALGKWFMAYDQYFDSDTQVRPNLAYSTDGKTWTVEGVLIDGSASYEKRDLGRIWCGCPSLLYEDGWFYVWYDCQNGTATDTYVALAKFQWDNVNNEIMNLERDAGNPGLYPPQDSEFEAGSWSHEDVVFYEGTYYMYMVRTQLGTTNFALALFTSTDKTSWTNQGKVLVRGASGQWDDKWIYRSSPVTDGTGTLVLFDGQMKLYYSAYSAAPGYPKIGYATSVPLLNDAVDLAGKCRTDFGDIRFTDNDGTTLLDYWMESKVDSTNAVFWVEVADSLESQAQTIHVYYGKADATTTSNGTNTFLFFDDFSGDLSKWTVLEGTVSIESGQMKLVSAGGYTAVRSNDLLPCSSRLEAKATFSNTNQYSRIGRTNSYSTSTHLPYADDAIGFDCWSDNKYYTETYNEGIATEKTDGTYDINAHTYELLTVSGTSGKHLIDDVLITQEHTTNVPNEDMWNFFQVSGRTMYVDDVRLGKYVSPEPSLGTWGSEQNPSTQASLYIDPQLTQKTIGDVGTAFNVNVTITDVTDLRGFDFNVTWDSSLLRLSSIDFNTTLDSVWGNGNWVIAVNQSGAGYYKIVAVSTADSFNSTSATSLAKLGFLVQDPQSNLLRQSSIHFDTHKLSDSQANAIAHTVTDGNYQITGIEPALELSPTSKTCRKYGETFTVGIDLSNAFNVTDFEFEVDFNTTLLDYSSITWNAWDTGTVAVDELNGKITGYTSGSAINGAQTLVTIEFTASFHRIWKNLPDWTNDLSGTILIQAANLSYPGALKLGYIKGGLNEITVGSDMTYTFSPIQGDIDNDGTVSIFDLRTVAAYYDQQNSTYNLTGDSTIDIYDLVVIGSNFGYTYLP